MKFIITILLATNALAQMASPNLFEERFSQARSRPLASAVKTDMSRDAILVTQNDSSYRVISGYLECPPQNTPVGTADLQWLRGSSYTSRTGNALFGKFVPRSLGSSLQGQVFLFNALTAPYFIVMNTGFQVTADNGGTNSSMFLTMAPQVDSTYEFVLVRGGYETASLPGSMLSYVSTLSSVSSSYGYGWFFFMRRNGGQWYLVAKNPSLNNGTGSVRPGIQSRSGSLELDHLIVPNREFHNDVMDPLFYSVGNEASSGQLHVVSPTVGSPLDSLSGHFTYGSSILTPGGSINANIFYAAIDSFPSANVFMEATIKHNVANSNMGFLLRYNPADSTAIWVWFKNASSADSVKIDLVDMGAGTKTTLASTFTSTFQGASTAQWIAAGIVDTTVYAYTTSGAAGAMVQAGTTTSTNSTKTFHGIRTTNTGCNVWNIRVYHGGGSGYYNVFNPYPSITNAIRRGTSGDQ